MFNSGRSYNLLHFIPARKASQIHMRNLLSQTFSIGKLDVPFFPFQDHQLLNIIFHSCLHCGQVHFLKQSRNLNKRKQGVMPTLGM